MRKEPQEGLKEMRMEMGMNQSCLLFPTYTQIRMKVIVMNLVLYMKY